jgi:hypothetical protein
MQDLIEMQNQLLEDFEYKDGEISWKKRGSGRVLGKKVGVANKRGYMTMYYRFKHAYVHRVIFLMHHGYLPKYIDHIDGNPSNNTIENLREATVAQNRANSKTPSTSKTGIKGVCWLKKEQRYFAYCMVNGKQHDLGTFKKIEEATTKVKEFREKNLGEFARHE